jgi:hypothetical protein
MLLHFINELLEFRIEPYKVTNIRKKNPSVMRIELLKTELGRKLLEIFENYDEQLDQLNSFRNLHIHEGKFHDASLLDADKYLQLVSLSERLNSELEPWMIVGYHFTQWELKNRRKGLIQMVQQQRDGMEISFINLTTMLTGTFWQRVLSKINSDE